MRIALFAVLAASVVLASTSHGFDGPGELSQSNYGVFTDDAHPTSITIDNVAFHDDLEAVIGGFDSRP